MKHIFTFFLILISSINTINVFAQVKPELIEPTDLQFAVFLKTNFRWECSDTISSFRFQLSEEENFSNLVVDSTLNKKNISFFFNKLHTVYYWRVASISDNKETFSDVFKFRTIKDTINLIYPPCDTTLHTNIIKPVWTSIEDANTYKISIFSGYNLIYDMFENDTLASIPFKAIDSGKYCYEITAYSGTKIIYSKSCCFYVDTNSTNDIREFEESASKLYPNPTHEKLNIKLSQFMSETSTIKIFNAIGNIVYQKDYTLGKENDLEIDVSTLNSGAYLLIIENQSRNIGKVFRFIKY